MNRRLFYIFVLLFMFVSCGDKPSGLLPPREMKEVLVDMHLAEYSFRGIIPSLRYSEQEEYVRSVYAKHNITKEQFDESVEWYAKDPKKYLEIYEEVVDSLEKLETMVEEYVFHPDEKPTYLDSIDTINVWFDNTTLAYTKPKSKYKRRKQFKAVEDSISFNYADTGYFAEGDVYRLNFRMRLYDANDSINVYNTNFYVERSDSVVDTISTCVQPDSVERIYTLSVMLADSIKPIGISGEFVDTINSEALLEIDSIRLYKIYNPHKHPLTSELEERLEDYKKAEPISLIKTGRKPLLHHSGPLRVPSSTKE